MSYKIALTSSDGEHIDTHFGAANSFRILQVDEGTGSWEFLAPRELPPDKTQNGAGCGGGGCGGPQDERLQSVMTILSDCRYVFTAMIGKKPFTFLQRAGITVLETPTDIPFAVSKLHAYHTRTKSCRARLESNDPPLCSEVSVSA